MRSLASWLLLSALVAGCGGKAVRPEPAASAVPAAQLRTRISIQEAACGTRPAIADDHRIDEQLRIARILSLRADERFLAAVKGRVPFAVAKAPWRDRPVIELSLEELRIEPAPPGSADGGRVKFRVALQATLPEAGIQLDRRLAYERALPVPGGEAASPEACLGPAVEEAATLAAGWLVEAANPP
jgi:hypothetical protein